jgi:hypothetical protein|tara:strand:- start:130 stop:330 length:201 start_codon:yes stop_codon:yes gene_type:complete
MASVNFETATVDFHAVEKVTRKKTTELGGMTNKTFYTSFFVVNDEGAKSEITFFHKSDKLNFEVEA